MQPKESFLSLFLKGAAMGAANVIPGVSGGTIAFITGIYQRLILAIKSFNLTAAKMLLKGQFKDFLQYIDAPFLLPLILGIFGSIFSLAKVLEYLFCNYEVLTLAFFFGLIAASVYLVGKQVSKWNPLTIVMLLIGLAIAVGISFLKPLSANDGFLWVFLCGIVAVSSMILPGLSGSYILLLLGNYILVLSAVGDFNMKILIPLGLGCGIGILVFSRLLAWLFDHFKDGTIGLLTGFVLGSLLIIWPWKNTDYLQNAAGQMIDRKGNLLTASDLCLDGVVLGYDRFIPSIGTGQFFLALALMILGAALVIMIERTGNLQGK